MAFIGSQLEQAQLENLTSDPTNLPTGRAWVNTTANKAKVYVESATRSVVTEDQTQTLTNKTFDTANNTFKSGSALNNQILTANGSGGTSWVTPSTGLDQSYEISNLTIQTSVAANALTVSLKTKANVNPSPSDPIKIGFRSSTLASGLYNQRTLTAALSLTVSSGSTLGQQNGLAARLYIYAIDNAGTIELAISQSYFHENQLVTTTAEGGAGAADSGTVMYSATARTNVPLRLIGTLDNTQTTAGTWTSAGTKLALTFKHDFESVLFVGTGATSIAVGAGTIVKFLTITDDTHNLYNAGTGEWTVPISGKYSVDVQSRVDIGSASLNQYFITSIYIDGSQKRQFSKLVENASVGYLFSGTSFKGTLLAGQKIKFQVDTNITAPNLNTSNQDTFMQIFKINE